MNWLLSMQIPPDPSGRVASSLSISPGIHAGAGLRLPALLIGFRPSARLCPAPLKPAAVCPSLCCEPSPRRGMSKGLSRHKRATSHRARTGLSPSRDAGGFATGYPFGVPFQDARPATAGPSHLFHDPLAPAAHGGGWPVHTRRAYGDGTGSRAKAQEAECLTRQDRAEAQTLGTPAPNKEHADGGFSCPPIPSDGGCRHFSTKRGKQNE